MKLYTVFAWRPLLASTFALTLQTVCLADEWKEYEMLGRAPIQVSAKYVDSLILAYHNFVEHLDDNDIDPRFACYSDIDNYLVDIEEDDELIVIAFTPHFSVDSECFETFGGGGKYWVDSNESKIERQLFFE